MFLQSGKLANKRVFFQREKHKCVEFSGDNVTYVEHGDVCSSENSILFVDSILKEEPIRVPAGTVIAFSSPDPQRYREFRKSLECCELILNPPSITDIEVLYNRLKLEHESNPKPEHGVIGATSFLEVKRNVEILGGIPRFVFRSESSCKDIVDKACAQYSRNIFYDLSLSYDGLPTGNEEAISYRITHLRSIDNLSRTYTFASDYVVRKLFSIYNGAELRNLVLQVSRNFLGSNVKGYLFESICHSFFIRNVKLRSSDKDGEKYFCDVLPQCQRLMISSSKQIPSSSFGKHEEEILSNVFTFDTVALYLPLEVNLAKGCYYQASRNQESVDAFAILSDDVYFFQYTTAKKHDVSGFGLYDIMKSISTCFGSGMKYHLIFVGIEESEHFKAFSLQKLLLSKTLESSNASKYTNDPNVSRREIVHTDGKIHTLLELNSKMLSNVSQHKLGMKFENFLDISSYIQNV